MSGAKITGVVKFKKYKISSIRAVSVLFTECKACDSRVMICSRCLQDFINNEAVYCVYNLPNSKHYHKRCYDELYELDSKNKYLPDSISGDD